MSPNGRRAWRRWAKKRLDIVDGFVSRTWLDARYWGKWRRHRKSLNPQRTIGLLPPKPITTRSLVGMTMGARKRLYRYIVDALPTEGDVFLICAEDEGVPIGWFLAQRLRPCPGCCACWGHRISSAYGEIAECCGPQTSGKRKSQIKAMRKWQETLADNCDGSGVLPARRS